MNRSQSPGHGGTADDAVGALRVLRRMATGKEPVSPYAPWIMHPKKQSEKS